MDESEPTPLHLPQNLPYPLKITILNANTNSNIDRRSRLVEYSFVYTPAGSEQVPETRFGTWDSAIEGVVKACNLKVGDVLTRTKAADTPAFLVHEPCKHEVQIGGLCALCAKDMTITDYLDAPDTARANIQMTHSAHGPTVSLEYAKRIEREAADHLLKSRKLSLIVDLDQTIVHATVDPTVGEWINEGQAWEARQAKKASTTPRDDGAEQTAPEPVNDDDECNPNWEALKDVKSFRLGPESFGPPAVRGAHRGKGKNKMVETEGCMYYIKPRPGWKEFLRETATKYEMHVYTMGTRAYAEEVCAAIDPDGNIFGGRLLSRDESGSLTQKNLKRLFPSDTSMVVIIDDRADVWEWSPNLLKVIPYDFFVGIGDINSSFLPKIEPLTPSVLNMPTPTVATSINGASTLSTLESSTTGPLETDASSTIPTVAPGEEITELETEMFTQNNAALDAQLEERPLAKKEKELQEHEIQEQQGAEQTQATAEETPASVENVPTPTPSPKPEKTHKKALLKNDDYELERIGKLLNEVHTRFFSAYDARRSSENARTRAGSSKAFDVTRIIPRIRSEVFDGVHILFSSVIPLDTKPESTEIWRMAHMFGAQCSTELTSSITHVVAAKRGTVKVDMARRRGGIKIVWLAWFTDSIALWRRQDEKPYLLDDPPAVIPNSSPNTEYHQLSSDLDIDSDDWDQEPPDMKDTGPLHLEAINWDDINDEVEAAMNESDDDDDEYYAQGFKSGNASEDDWTDGGGNNTAQTSKKRFRSSTPSDSGGNEESGGTSRKRMRSATPSDGGNDYGSPLARRRKVAAERTGYSKLKEGITADDIGVVKDDTASGNGSALPDANVSSPGVTYEDDGDDEEDEEEEEEDDFLARELEEEWG